MSKKFGTNLIFIYGALHTGFLLDCVLLEWDNGLCRSSLICPIFDTKSLLMLIVLKDSFIEKLNSWL